MSKLFEIVSDLIEITGNSTVDSILLAIIGLISFLVAFDLVGIIFDSIGLYDSDVMSDCHWFIRLLVFIGLSAICIFIVKFFTWLFSFQWWIYVIILVVVIGITVLVHFIKYKLRKKSSALVKAESLIEKNVEANEEIVTDEKSICPRCGGMLVKRHGPYGDFYGCENFSSNNCRYTRRFK